MKKENRNKILLCYSIIILLMMIPVCGIIYHLVDNTVISADKWNEKANKELSEIVVINPERGDILACDGAVLATNLRYYTLHLDYLAEGFRDDTLKKYIDPLCDSLAKYFPRRNAAEWRTHLLKPLTYKKRPRYYTMIANIGYTDMQLIKTFPYFRKRRFTKSGLTVESKLRRVTPYGDMARRSIGSVGQLETCDEVHGISGLEKALDTLLYGVPGIAKKIPLTKGIVNWTDKPAVNGFNLLTTIDIKMQDILENELNNVLTYCDAEWGVAVLMDVKTGDIKAISNLEKDDKRNRYIEGMNRAVRRFEPGSVVKTLSMMIALEDGIVSDLDEVITTGASYAYAGGRAISDSHGVASMKVREVIERSSNIGMTKIITKKYGDDPSKFYERIKQTGFLDTLKTGIAGEVPPKFARLKNDRGGRISLSRQCFGYNSEIPPLYTLALYNAIANDGKFVKPRLVSGLISEEVDSTLPVEYVRQQVCSPANAAKLREMLTAVVWGDHGTARSLRDNKVRIAGKTGTCFMVSEHGGYDSRKRLAFCGFFPAENPVYSCIVLTCNPRQNAFGAASTSGQVVKNIALKLYSRGMLNNSSDYRADAADQADKDSEPVFYAALNRDDVASLGRAVTGNDRTRLLPSPAVHEKGVPDVVGLGLREAVSTMEKAGYNVSFTGLGHVAAQSVAPGSPLAAGTRIMLTLKE